MIERGLEIGAVLRELLVLGVGGGASGRKFSLGVIERGLEIGAVLRELLVLGVGSGALC